MGLLGRHAINLLGTAWIFVLIFVDDLHIASGGSQHWKHIWPGVGRHPFSYKKFRGGFTSDYVGYWLDYGRFEIGVSERRTAWLVNFVDQLEADNWLVMAMEVSGIPWAAWIHLPGFTLGAPPPGSRAFLAGSSEQIFNG